MEMKVIRIRKGVYKIQDNQGTWIARGGEATGNGQWVANECEKEEDCCDENNWAVSFKTFKELKEWSQKFN
jgi:hypothetical protein